VARQAAVDSPAGKPLLTPSASTPLAPDATAGSLGIALVAGAAVALVGGLVWAGVVIETHYDFGILAWIVGAATGGTVFYLTRAPVRGPARALTGLLAVAGMVVGKYVIFVDAVKKTLGTALAQQGTSVSYLDSRQMGIFIHHFNTVVRPIYFLWFLLALVAALRAAGGERTLPGQRRRSSPRA
jgi:hypothetical protein